MVALIEAIDVSKRFAGGLGREGTLALAGLSLAIDAEKPSIIAVVGESGSGKTTLARLLLGLAEPSGGEIRYHGADLRALDRDRRRAFRHDVQAVFQDPYSVDNPLYRVDHVLTTPLRRFRLAGARAEAREVISNALRAVGLQPEEILGRFPRQLSGSQRPRVMVARALIAAKGDRRRRAGFDGRCVVARDGPLVIAQVDRRARHLDLLHHPQPRDSLPSQRLDPRSVPHASRRGRWRGAGGNRTLSPLYAAPGLGDPARRHCPRLAYPG